MKRIFKKGISSFLVVVMMMSLFVGIPQTAYADSMPFDSGTGTQGDPYIIMTPEQLDSVRDYVGDTYEDTYFEMGDDIDLEDYLSDGGAGYNSGKGWTPIGDMNNYFEGHFDGAYYTISNLSINDPNLDGVGLFGYTTSNATISNLMLENVNIVGGNQVGGLVGVSDCKYDESSSNYNPTVITNCGTTGTVSGRAYVGGLAGDNYGTIQYSYSACTVSGINEWSMEMGGLVGKNWGDKGLIDNCYSVGSVSGYDEVGGLVGYNRSGEDFDGTVNQSYAAGKVTIHPDASEYGGLIGSKSTNAICTDSFYDEDTTEMTDTGKGEGEGIANMKREAGSNHDPYTWDSNVAWDFTTIWTIDPGISYPYFQWQALLHTAGRTDYAMPLVNAMQSSSTATTSTLVFSADEDCTAYYVFLPTGSTAPTEAQVKAGQDSTGTGVDSNLKGSLSLDAATLANPFTPVTVTGLQAATTYDVYIVYQDVAGNILYYPIIATTAYDKTYKIDTIAGTGTASSTMPTLPGDATTKAIGLPEGIAIDGSGNKYISDADMNVVYKVDTLGNMIIFAGSATGTAGYSGDGGPAIAATLDSPYGLAFDSSGNLYIADMDNNAIRKVDTSGNISTVIKKEVNPCDVTVDSNGTLYFTDTGHSPGRVYKVDNAGNEQQITGSFDYPKGIAADSSGNVYVADDNNSVVYKIDSNETVTTVAGGGSIPIDGVPANDAVLQNPVGVAVDADNNLYISDQGANVIRIVDARNNNIYTIAGTGTLGYTGDGGDALAADMTFSYAGGLALDSHGNIYFTDDNNSVVRKLALVSDSYIVTYDSQGGSTVSSMTAAPGANITAPTAPTRSSYSFGGWYKEAECTNVWNFSTDTVAGDVTLYAKWTASSSGSGSGGSSSGSSSPPVNTGVVVLVNGTSYNVGTATQGTRDGQTLTTIAANETQLRAKMDEKGNGATVTVPVSTKTDIVIGELSGQIIKDMETKQDTLEIRTGSASYFLPASELKADSIAAQFGTNVKLEDIKFQAEIAQSTDDTVKVVEDSAQSGSFSIVIPPMDFTVKAVYGGKTIDISKFNVYIERLIAVPDGVDQSKITTGVITEPDGNSRHVPTEVTQINGKYYVRISSLSNSTYTVVWHPLEFADVANHWAKEVVNDMGSRMVVTGVGNGLYEPNRDITRAEFAAIVVRALGLKTGDGSNSFTDVAGSKWYSDYVKTATSYGIIKGYGDGNFGPNDKITREQAMTMIARAMDITGLKADLSSGDAEKLLAEFTDGSSASSYAKETIAACVKTGVVSGRGGNIVAPKDYITRAEVAAIVSRLLQKSDLI